MKTILVVEDLALTRQIICDKLERKGYQTLGVGSFQEAYDRLAHDRGKINLVLSDVDIPDSTGFDLLRSIKKNPGMKDLPVVFCTADFHSDKISFTRETGVASFIQKPFRDDMFFKEIERALTIKGSIINVVA